MSEGRFDLPAAVNSGAVDFAALMRMEAIDESAVSMCEAGLFVFPMAQGKIPTEETGFYAASSDPETTYRMFGRAGVAAIGIATGMKNGIVVIDIDVKKADDNGMQWFTDNQYRLPPTWTHRTTSGGYHLIYGYPAGEIDGAPIDIRNNARRLGAGVDVRANRGYVVLPERLGYTSCEDNKTIAPLPMWLVDALAKRGKVRGEDAGIVYATSEEWAALDPVKRQDHVARMVQRTLSGLQAIEEGEGRNTAMNEAAFKFGQYCAAGQLDSSTALAQLLEVSDVWGGNQEKTEDTFERAFNSGIGFPRGIPAEFLPPEAARDARTAAVRNDWPARAGYVLPKVDGLDSSREDLFPAPAVALGGVDGARGVNGPHEVGIGGAGSEWTGVDTGERKPPIIVSPELDVTASEADALLAASQPVWQMGGELVTWYAHETLNADGSKAEAVGLNRIDAAQLKDFLAASADWYAWRVDAAAKKEKKPKKETKKAKGGKDAGVDGAAGAEVDAAPLAVDLDDRSAEDAAEDEPGARLVRCKPPEDITRILLTRQGKRPIRVIAGIVTAPVLRGDGSVVSAPGYDDATLLFYRPSPTLTMPAGWDRVDVTRAEAVDGLAVLDGLLDGFGFEGAGTDAYGVNRAVALSAILTPIARTAMDVAPGHGFTARSIGSGKTMLLNLVSMIATGNTCSAGGAAVKEDETEKVLTGLALRGTPIIALDNVNAELRSDLLSRLITEKSVTLRPLGSSVLREIDNRCSFYATGNNMRLTGDLIRRVLPCRLDVGGDKPYNKRYDFNPVDKVRQDRGFYVAAALSVLRGYIQAGRPGLADMTPLASYERWTATVRGALMWLGRPDPVKAMEEARNDDPDIVTRREIIMAWKGKFGVSNGMTSSGAIEAMGSNTIIAASATGGEGAFGANVVPFQSRESVDAAGVFREVISRNFAFGGQVNVRVLGKWLSRNEGVDEGGYRFMKRSAHGGAMVWSVVPTPQ